MIDKKIAFLAASFVVLAVVLFTLFSGDTGAIGETQAALDHLGEQQRRAERAADRIVSRLDDSRGAVIDIERANSYFAETVGNAERLNNAVKNSVINAHGRLARAERLIDDSQRRIAACKEILSENREGIGQSEKEK